MPFTRIAVRGGKPAPYRKALAHGIHRALMEVFNAPEDDIFMVVTEHDADSFFYGRHYLGIERSDDLVLIQIAVSNTRGQDQKKALFARIADNLARDPGVRREDVFVNLVDVARENWSFGNGVAQYAT
ncbi:tautomerase family protein [Paraburkholderia caballeronis]|uniref:Phenylpyruvate tautomerase PptA, 4-oxalocrotonate tautomerase family n=1 Tax=Paraburkholderia caballeronis TaxID=416943 RepID=A0A1H7KVL2_9BURK|nr:tautomerase family protein [Paraburkholderia caballeronis]PXW28182.1 phenylpyruvate tautomerase PptA (4-oxalocrotonate tautomerase family) [Paraburkholderia caballeronis]PXX03548.1 phenylpyruvate tautomerase PptA (4-oxalocrotonate tautomerase family) [Paraburkholderia caballeronis]RAK04292.1 phenylpyruvate tautomerase PptA (4-oxalocrotonate tautomerase family) [Paraburkholderia caballeronis]TDV19335.1 phenylpyruvate tautomerase PptA (4-oxalocrotonate tautomerase family) [Paraburkholderia cab